ncbi:valine--tRNA ligase [Zavarzinella formosa]|uniref:valine--tRNA ligase n=1 Tax=Zavarzinella formosa TaxID=360055 RepID=UPI0002D3B0BA|nr:valine--tRNA ligase [Zavarzinella formosa]
MPTEMAKAYDPKEAQTKWLAYWDELAVGHAEADPSKKPFSIVIPPPNVTGALHLGHALNNTLQDVLIRWRRMQGYNAEWIPGTDHAGIATQSVVEKRIFQEEKKTRHDLGREELVGRIWKWKEQYEKRILGQLRELGASADWQRTRFTLDPMCAKAVRETFFRMFRDGYIYRGKRLVNWDTQLQTSVSDDETTTEDTNGGFWTFKYPVKGMPDTFIRFSTTRPETMLGDTAVCVHPSDERYKALVGKMVTIPLVGREIPIIADALLADPTLGTGCVKVTPAHDPNDYACWTRNPQIGMINILNPDGTINSEGGKYAGLDRFKAREAVVAAMEELGFFEGKEDRKIPLKYSDRSKTIIEPLLSDQWFVKMTDRDDGKPGLAQMAMDAVTDGRVKFFPERYASSYLDWLGEKRDWCVSRQLWWGHRIPVWTAMIQVGGIVDDDYEAKLKKIQQSAIAELSDFLTATGISSSDYVIELDGEATLRCCTATEKAEKALQALQSYKESCLFEKVVPGKPIGQALREVPGFEMATSAAAKIWSFSDLKQDSDVLDTWFSSALWPHSTFGWPEPTPELKHFYPTSVLVTSRDIITLWVARMVMTGLYNMGDVPFRNVYVHTKILDGFGEGMSKSKGNGVDPLDIIELYGTDALRFGMVALATETQDSRMPVVNICPHCSAGVPVKQEHMYMRTKKLTCPSCKKPFRPGGPWLAEDPELPTAKQGSDRFEMGRNFANKLWNATRFILMNLEGYTPAAISPESLPIEDRWILSRLVTTANAITESLDGFRFSEVTKHLYDFSWSEFCDWYIEMAKGRMKDPAGRAGVQQVLAGVLDAIVRLAQPVMPFLAESLWQSLNEAAPVRGFPEPTKAGNTVTQTAWPTFPAMWQDTGMETRIARMQELVRIVRDVRNRYMVDGKTALNVSVKCGAEVAKDFEALKPFITLLAGVGEFKTSPDQVKPKQAASQVTADFECYVSLEGLIDPAAEVKRLEKQLADKVKSLEGTEKKLNNADFVKRAPESVITEQRELLADLTKQIASLKETIAELKS